VPAGSNKPAIASKKIDKDKKDELKVKLNVARNVTGLSVLLKKGCDGIVK